jgi:drug/metabolite transporter (DMT)-like permease
VSRKGWLLFCALCVVWGIPYLLIRIAVRELPPATLVLGRTAPVALLMLPFVVRRSGREALHGRWRWVFAYSMAELAVPWLLLAHAEQRLSSSVAGLLVASVPLMGAVLSRLTGAAERLSRRRLAGLVLGFVGVAALAGFDSAGGRGPVAVAEVLVVALGYATGPLIISRRLADLPGLSVVAASLVITALLYAPLGLAQLPSAVSGETVAAVATLALVCTALAFILFFALIVEVGPTRATVITYVNPVIAVLLGVAFLHERLGVGIAVALPLILGGSVLGTSRPAASAQPGAPRRVADAGGT